MDVKVYIVLGILAIFFIYLLIWSFNLHFHTKRQKKVKRVQELRAKGNEIKKRTIDCTKDYWYNLREVEDRKEEEDFEKYYHYFIGVDQGVHDLLIEMYDCGIVRTDELEEIAYGKNHLRNVDLSFLEELEREMEEEDAEEEDVEEAVQGESEEAEPQEEEDGQSEMVVVAAIEGDAEDSSTEDGLDRMVVVAAIEEDAEDSSADDELDGMVVVAAIEEDIEDSSTGDEIVQVGGIMSDFFEDSKDVVSAAKNLKKDDPGIMDIHGTLSDGVIDVLEAVEAEKQAEEEKFEPILPKKEKSVEESRKAREMTANAEIRNKIYERWVGYVFELYEMVSINANEDTKHKIRKALMDYGYNDVEVLLESPE